MPFAGQGSVSSLPVRMNKTDHLSAAASAKLVQDWNTHIGPYETDLSYSPRGNLYSFIFFDGLPERMSATVYLTELGVAFDG